MVGIFIQDRGYRRLRTKSVIAGVAYERHTNPDKISLPGGRICEKGIGEIS